MIEIQDSDAARDAPTIWDYLQGPEAQVGEFAGKWRGLPSVFQINDSAAGFRIRIRIRMDPH